MSMMMNFEGFLLIFNHIRHISFDTITVFLCEIFSDFFNIKKLRIIKELLHKGHKEDTELHKDFLEPYKEYKFI
jgi:hypothetical protein